jgi:hypothetical protein
MSSFVKDENTEDSTIRTYQYERRYLTKNGDIRTSVITTTRKYKPNASSRLRRTYTEAQKNIIKYEYGLLKNYSATSRIISKKYGFLASAHYVKQVVLV